MEALRYTPHYTADDHEQWEGDWELLRGTAVAMSPAPSYWHQVVVKNLVFELESALRQNPACTCTVTGEPDWRVAHDTVVRPDVVVMCEPVTTRAIQTPPTLAAEVISPSTASKDRLYKRELYAEQGVRWYLLVDPDAETLEALRLEAGRYVAVEAVDGAVSIDLHDGCAVSVRAVELWR